MTRSITLITALASSSLFGVTNYYVNAARPNDAGNGLTWTTAKKTIQAAVIVATNNDTIWVTNGVYDVGGVPAHPNGLTNRVCITKPLTVRSVNGASVTTIRGSGGALGHAAVRCVYMENGCTLSGFTLADGRTFGPMPAGVLESTGGGVLLFQNCSVRNCNLQDNIAGDYGGGAYCAGPGTFWNVSFIRNVANRGGGGLFMNGGKVTHATFAMNRAVYYHGGGVWIGSAGTLMQATFSGNDAGTHGGGAYLQDGGAISNATFTGNNAITNGGAVYIKDTGFIYTSLLIKNTAKSDGGGAYLDEGGALHGCTIASNRAARGGGVVCYSKGSNVNCIIYHNMATIGGMNHYGYDTGMRYMSCCLTPLPSGLLNAGGNITNPPQFISVSSNYRLSPTSPCIDAGLNLPWMIGATDLDGNPRIYDGRVDMGCYEFVPEPGMWGVLGVFTIYNLRCTIWRKRREQ